MPTIPDQHLPGARILIVDDQPANVALLRRVLERAGYARLRALSDPREVAPLVKEWEPDLILLDLNMPHLSGMEILQTLRSHDPAELYRPVLVLTADASSSAKHAALDAGASDFLTKPFDLPEVLLRVRNLLQIRFLNVHMHDLVRERTRALEEAQVEILQRLAQAAEFRDDDTGMHTRRVGELSASIARRLDLENGEVELIRRAAALHDVGKIAVPDAILLKPGRLDPEEWAVMKRHTTAGAEILSGGSSELVFLAETIARSHHERWDGTGYPEALAGEDIPLPARIVAVADFHDALSHPRPYRDAFAPEAVRSELERGAGTHFDPRVLQTFLTLLDEREAAGDS